MVHVREQTADLYVTIMRRKYIPPLLETFQDIIIASKFNFQATDSDESILKRSNQFLKEVH